MIWYHITIIKNNYYFFNLKVQSCKLHNKIKRDGGKEWCWFPFFFIFSTLYVDFVLTKMNLLMCLIYGGGHLRRSSVVMLQVFLQTDFFVGFIDNIAHREYFIGSFNLLTTFTSHFRFYLCGLNTPGRCIRVCISSNTIVYLLYFYRSW